MLDQAANSSSDSPSAKPVASCPWNKGRPFTADTNSFFVKDYPARGRCRAPSKYSALCAWRKIPHAIATASYRPLIDASLEAVDVGPEIVVVEGNGGLQGKPEPDLFLAAQKQLGVAVPECVVIGDAVWDHVAARRAGMMSVGVLTGGYGEEELYHAGAFRVYRHIADLLQNLDELGILL